MAGGISGAAAAGAYKLEGNYSQFQAETNARFAEAEASQVIIAGKKESQEYGKMVKGVIGSQRAGFAASGLDVSAGGTVAEVQADTEIRGRLDQLTIKNNAWKEAFGLKIEAAQGRFQGKMDAAAARTKARGSLISGYASDIGTYATLGASQYGLKKGSGN